MTPLLRRKLLLWIGSLIGALLLVITTLAIYLDTRSDEWWRDLLTTKLSQTLGREVEIQGEFHLVPGRITTIEAASVRISNPDWTKSRDMLRLGSMLLKFDLLSVLGETLLIHRLELADIDLALEENQKGEKNWGLATETESPPARKTGADLTLPVRIKQLSLQRIQLSLSQSRWQHPLVLKVETITGGLSPDDEAVLDGSGRLGNLPFSFKASMGKITSALNAGPVSYQLSGKLGGASLRSEGSIDSLKAPLRPQLDLILSGPDIMQITQAMGAPKIAKGPFKASVKIAPGGRGVSSRIRGQFGKLQLRADISAEGLGETKNMDVSAQLSGENLASFSDLLGLPPLPKGAFKVDVVLQRDNNITRIEKMIANVARHRISVAGVVGPWPEMKDTRLELQAKGPSLAVFTPTVAGVGLAPLPSGAYTANVLIEPSENGFYVRPSRVKAGGYQVTAEGHVTTRDQVRAELDVTGSGPDLAIITRLADIIQLPPWPFQATGRIDITSKDITIIGASGTAGKHKVEVDGPIAFSPTGPVRLDVKGSGPSLQAVLKGLGYDVILAAAAYQVEGRVEFNEQRVVVTAKQARLGPVVASATLTIPDVSTATTLVVDVGNVKTSDISVALALVGVKLDIPQVMPANLSGQVRRTKDTTGFSEVQGTIGTTTLEVDGIIGDPPGYTKTRVSLDITGSNLESFLSHPIDKAIPFQIKGGIALDKGYMRFEDLQLKAANIEARAQGQVGNWQKIAGTELSISAQGPNLETIAAILNRPLREGAIKIDGHISGTENAYHMDRLDVELGRSNLSGDLKLTQGEPPRLSGRVSSTYLDYALFRKEAKPKKTAKTKTKKTLKIGLAEAVDDTPRQKQLSMFPDTPIKLEILDRLDLDLKVSIDELANLWEQESFHDLTASVLLKDSSLTVSDFKGRGSMGGKVSGKLAIKRDADLSRFDVDITGQQLRLGLAAAPGQDPTTFPPTDLEIRLTGAGRTYRQLAASLAGRVKAVQGKGRISNRGTDKYLSDVFYEVFQAVNPFAKKELTTRLNCSVYIVNLADGTAEIQAIVIQTDKLNIVSAGSIDLNTEQVDINFETRPRKGVGISASSITNSTIKLGGSMSNPAIVLDPGRAIVATGAAVATAGLTILARGFWDRFLSARDPCGEALKRDAELQALKARQP